MGYPIQIKRGCDKKGYRATPSPHSQISLIINRFKSIFFTCSKIENFAEEATTTTIHPSIKTPA